MRDRRKQRALRRAKAQNKAQFPLDENRNRDPTFYEAMSNINREQYDRIYQQNKQARKVIPTGSV